jgi:hypothetical protein
MSEQQGRAERADATQTYAATPQPLDPKRWKTLALT